MEKKRYRFWFRLGMIVVIVFIVFFAAFRALQLWNLWKDFGEIYTFFPAGPTVTVPFADGLEPPEELGEEIANCYSSMLNSTLSPASLTALFERLPDRKKTVREILRRANESFDSPPRPLANLPAKIPFPEPDIMIGGITDEGKYWAVLAEGDLENRPASETVGIFIAIALLGSHAEFTGVTRPTLMGMMVGVACQSVATHALLRLAMRLPLTLSEVRSAYSSLRTLEENLAGLEYIFRFEQIYWLSIGDYLRSTVVTKGSSSWERWPGKMLSDCIYESKTLTPVPSMGTIDLDSEARAARQRVTTIGIHWLVYCASPQEYFEDLLITEKGLIIGGAITQEVGRQRRHMQGARAILALVAHHTENGRWASSSAEISDWLGESWPSDVGSGPPLLLIPGDPPKIIAAGDDGKTGTPDDEQLFPFLP